MPRVTAHAADTSRIDPQSLYTRPGFIKASGFAAARIAQLAAEGVRPSWLKVGRRHYIEGSEAIEFIKAAAKHEEAKQAAQRESAPYA